jgi:hypothetical protein
LTDDVRGNIYTGLHGAFQISNSNFGCPLDSGLLMEADFA